jgi:hypothetical protein
LEQPLRPTGWFSERTAWVGRLTPLRRFVRTETGGAAVLVAAVLAALVWVNVGSSYQEVWETPVALTFGDDGIRLSLREWVNTGLMTFLFLVTGLEARREIDLGELRERRRLVLPLPPRGRGAAGASAPSRLCPHRARRQRARRTGSDRRALLARPRPDCPGMGRDVRRDHRRHPRVRRAQQHSGTASCSGAPPDPR